MIPRLPGMGIQGPDAVSGGYRRRAMPPMHGTENVMNLLRLLNSMGKQPFRMLMVHAAASALSTTIVLAVVTHAAKTIHDAKAAFVDLPLSLIFNAGAVAYVISESTMIAKLAAGIEKAIDRLRMKMIHRLRHAELWKLEHFGQSRLFGSITQNCKAISSNSQYIAQAVRSILLIVMILVYIASISVIAMLLLSAMMLAAATCYYRLGKSLEQSQMALADQEVELFDYVSDLFDGFKEQRLCSVRSRAMGEGFAGQSFDTVTARSKVHQQTWEQFVFGETTFYIMLGIVVFVVPIYSPSVSTNLVKISAAVLFMGTPIFGLMQSLAVLRATEAAAGRMLQLEEELSALEEKGSLEPFEPLAANFSEIRMENVEFAFPAPEGERAFRIGPIDIRIKRGEVVFISGGNGAGKSTLIKLLTGLYQPERGRLSLDGLPIVPARLAGYRILIAPVFSDFYLFSKLYGLADIDMAEADDLLRWMEMETISTIREGKFSRIDLSTGQRKRLALVAALLERKPILVLDEWAADQDSQFRMKFYHEILPDLRRSGLTIIAVTHDDRYFDAADRRLHLDEGRLTEYGTRPGNDPWIGRSTGGDR
jgi:cyclic peptide transporter